MRKRDALKALKNARKALSRAERQYLLANGWVENPSCPGMWETGKYVYPSMPVTREVAVVLEERAHTHATRP